MSFSKGMETGGDVKGPWDTETSRNSSFICHDVFFILIYFFIKTVPRHLTENTLTSESAGPLNSNLPALLKLHFWTQTLLLMWPINQNVSGNRQFHKLWHDLLTSKNRISPKFQPQTLLLEWVIFTCYGTIKKKTAFTSWFEEVVWGEVRTTCQFYFESNNLCYNIRMKWEFASVL